MAIGSVGAAIPTIGLLSWRPPAKPKNSASSAKGENSAVRAHEPVAAPATWRREPSATIGPVSGKGSGTALVRGASEGIHGARRGREQITRGAASMPSHGTVRRDAHAREEPVPRGIARSKPNHRHQPTSSRLDLWAMQSRSPNTQAARPPRACSSSGWRPDHGSWPAADGDANVPTAALATRPASAHSARQQARPVGDSLLPPPAEEPLSASVSCTLHVSRSEGFE